MYKVQCRDLIIFAGLSNGHISIDFSINAILNAIIIQGPYYGLSPATLGRGVFLNISYFLNIVLSNLLYKTPSAFFFPFASADLLRNCGTWSNKFFFGRKLGREIEEWS